MVNGICKTCVYCWWLGKLPDQTDDMLWVKCGHEGIRIEAEVENSQTYEDQTTIDNGFRLWAYTEADTEKCQSWAAKPPAWFHTDLEPSPNRIVARKRKLHSGGKKSKVRRKVGSVSKMRHKTDCGD